MVGSDSLVSVIIPLFNAEKFIGETIRSVVTQSYNNWELIIVDDCSTDGSRDIVREYEKKDSRIKLIESRSNHGGPARPRNIGLENANGEYIAFLDADDLWLENKLKIQLNHIAKYNYNFISSNVSLIDANSKNIDIKYLVQHTMLKYINKYVNKYALCDLIKRNFITTSSTLIKKELIGSFDESQNIISVEDYGLWLEIFHNDETRYGYIDQKLLEYRILNDSVSDRKVKHKQATKANFCILKFILKNKRYDMVTCYYSRIIKMVGINILKRIIGKY